MNCCYEKVDSESEVDASGPKFVEQGKSVCDSFVLIRFYLDILE